MGFDCSICIKLLEADPTFDPLPSTSTSYLGVVHVIPEPESEPKRSKPSNDNDNQKINIVATACGHLFHRWCITNWLKNSGGCPSCRAPCSMDQLLTLYPNLNVQQSRALQKSKKNAEKLELKLHSLKSKNSALKSALTEAKITNSNLTTNINSINAKCTSQESQLRGVTMELEQCRFDLLNLVKHYHDGDDNDGAAGTSLKTQVQEIPKKYNNFNGSHSDSQLDIVRSSCNSSNISIKCLYDVLPKRIPTLHYTAFDIDGEYELLSSRNFKGYLAAIRVKFGETYISEPPSSAHERQPEPKEGSRLDRTYWLPDSDPDDSYPIPKDWEREPYIIKVGPVDYSIHTSYYYNEELLTTKLKFKLGEEFHVGLEGTGDYEDNLDDDDEDDDFYDYDEDDDDHDEHPAKDDQSVHTIISLESPTLMKQVQTAYIYDEGLRVILWREFSRNGLMKVTYVVEGCHGTSDRERKIQAVRVYEKIWPGLHKEYNLKKQVGCRDISSDEDDEFEGCDPNERSMRIKAKNKEMYKDYFKSNTDTDESDQ